MSGAFVVSIYTWVLAMFFSSAVKYPRLWWISPSWSALALAIMTYSIAYVRGMQGKFRPASLVTGPGVVRQAGSGDPSSPAAAAWVQLRRSDDAA